MIPLSTKGAWLEFIGTFVLCTYGGFSVFMSETGKGGEITSAAGHGTIVAVFMAIAIKPSGAQFNPAVAVALYILQKQKLKTTVIYSIIQMTASFFSGMFLYYMRPTRFLDLESDLGYPHVPDDFPIMKAFILEALTTGVLILCIYELAFERKVENWLLSIFIGTVVFFLSLTVGSVCGCAMNPARTFGPSIWASKFLHGG